MSEPTEATAMNIDVWTPSKLTVARPDIWTRGLELASSVTGMTYLDKLPRADGIIYACGGDRGGVSPILEHWWSEENRVQREWEEREIQKNNDRVNRSNREADRKRKEERKKRMPEPEPESTPTHEPGDVPLGEQIKQKIDELDKAVADTATLQKTVERLRAELLELINQKPSMNAVAQSVLVPSGAMEWLLHEVGHWVGASEEERRLQNYGDSRETEAMAFEEIVLARYGQARDFVPPKQRDGCAFESGPTPDWAFRRIDRQLSDGNIAVEPFRLLWSEWVEWGLAQGDRAPWKMVN